MTAGLPEVVREFAAAFSWDFRSTTVGLVLVVVLVILLIVREVLHGWSEGRAHVRLDVLDVAVLPLGVGFGIIILARLIDLL